MSCRLDQALQSSTEDAVRFSDIPACTTLLVVVESVLALTASEAPLGLPGGEISGRAGLFANRSSSRMFREL